MWCAQLGASWIFLSCFYLWMTFLPGCLFAVVVIKCFMIGVNVWWVYLAPQNIPRAISVLTLGNKVILYCIVSVCAAWAKSLLCLSRLCVRSRWVYTGTCSSRTACGTIDFCARQKTKTKKRKISSFRPDNYSLMTAVGNKHWHRYRIKNRTDDKNQQNPDTVI